MNQWNRALLAVLMVCFSSCTVMAQSVVLPALPATVQNTVPFGTGTPDVPLNDSTMHQVFASSQFSSLSGGLPIQITDIGFATGSAGTNISNLTVRLGYTTRTPGVASPLGLEIPVGGGGGAPNATGDMSVFYSNQNYSAVTVSSTTDFSRLHVPGSFIYDPTHGNLLVEIVNLATFGNGGTNTRVYRAVGSDASSRSYTSSVGGNVESPGTAIAMKFTYTVVPGVTGRCCYPNGSCAITIGSFCTGAGGIYAGDSTNCSPNVCPQPPTGACCKLDETCSILSAPDCTTATGGAYQGNSTVCGICPALPIFYSNCNIKTGATTSSGVGGLPAGSEWSEVGRDESDPTIANSTSGFVGTGPYRIADDFVVPPGGLNLSYIRVYAYQPEAVTASVYLATVRILDDSPLGTPNVIFGDTTTNRLAYNAFAPIYRCFNTVTPITCGDPLDLSTPDQTRHLQYIYINVNQFLPAGTYWIDYNFTGASFSPTSVRSDTIGRQCNPNNSNGLAFDQVSWNAMADGGQGCSTTTANQDVFFDIIGTPPTGACCNGTACTVGTQAACTGTYKGNTTTCDFPSNPVTCCPANYDGANGVQVADIFAFLNGWFAGDPQADFNGGGLSVSDIFSFLNAWFTGC